MTTDAATEIRKFADKYEATASGDFAEHAAPAEYWRGAHDAVEHVLASLRNHAKFLEEGHGD